MGWWAMGLMVGLREGFEWGGVVGRRIVIFENGEGIYGIWG